uniref:Uncharacterized protein n=1 Tax=Arundo donax TaxID=35708 RepID=A0A0A9H1V4_ARUDO
MQPFFSLEQYLLGYMVIASYILIFCSCISCLYSFRRTY